MFELKDVEIIREVVRCGGFRAAAQKLRLSQSAVSTRVSEAEQRIGVELLDRKRHGARLTPLGRRFLDQAERLLEMRDQIASSLHPSSGFAGTIRIGAAESIVHILLPDMLRGIRNVFPDARLELSVDLSPVLARRLSAGGRDQHAAVLLRTGLVRVLLNDSPHASADTGGTGAAFDRHLPQGVDPLYRGRARLR
jgi:DNA-binding transcriptional LysR family regulator